MPGAMSATLARLTLALMLSGLLSGCAMTTGPRLSTSGMPVHLRGIVVVVDGAGGTSVTSQSLDQVVQAQRLPLAVVAYDWSHGWGRFIADNWDTDHLEQQGQDLAQFLVAAQKQYPGLPIHVLAYSAGSSLVVRAAQQLPPNSLGRVVFLAPAVSAHTDVRPLLCSARCGLDVYTSQRDVFYLGLGVRMIGPTGGGPLPAAGRAGFQPVIAGPSDVALYQARLRHHPWGPEYSWTGNTGQHGGGHAPKFLSTYIVPSFMQSAPSAAIP